MDMVSELREPTGHAELHIAIEHSMTGIARLDRAGRYTEVLSGYASMLGYQPQELLGRSWSLSVHERDLPNGIETYEQMLAQGRAEGEVLGLRKDGSTFFKRVLLVKTVDVDGNRTGHFCFTRDVSEHNAVERALARAQAFGGRLLDSIADGVVVLSPEGRTLAVNMTLCAMLGYERDELLAGEPFFYVPLRLRGVVAKGLRRITAGRLPTR